MRIRATLLLLLSLLASPVAAQERGSQDDRFQAALGVARVRRDAGDFTAARRSFEEARTLRAFDAAQLAEYFWVVVASKDSAAAFKAGREALAADPSNHKVRDRLVTEAIALGKEADVVAISEQGLQLQNTTALWPRRIAESYLRQRQPSQAADAFLAASRMADANDKDREALAVALESAGRYREAADAWRKVTASPSSLSADVARSRLRALAHSRAADAPAELEAWLARNPSDTEIRTLAVDTWTRLNQPEKALAIAAPLTSDDWLRAKAGIARKANLNGRAIEFLNKLGRRMTTGDRLAVVELMILDRRFDEATAVLSTMSTGPLACDERVLELADRIPGDSGTRSLIRALGEPPCQKTTWLARAIERSVAAADHQTALKLIDRFPTSAAGTNANLRLKGQVQLWTGNAAQAIPTLEAVVGQFPADAAARESLIDAYRVQHRADDAWRVAGPLVVSESLSDSRRLSLAALALDVDRPAAALSLIGSTSSNESRQLLGRALLMSGRPADAKATLAAIAPEQLNPPAALALVDAIAAVDGSEAARSAASTFDRRTAEWGDLLARRVVLERSAGQHQTAAAVRSVLAGLNPQLAAIADIESELAEGHPRRALELIAALPNDPQSQRVSDLEATARAESGDPAGAIAILETLSQLRPESAGLKKRLAELHDRIEQRPAKVSTVSPVTDVPANAAMTPAANSLEASLTRARDFAATGRWRESLEAVDAALAVHANAPEALKLRAEVLSWSGRHADAVKAYDAYLNQAPQDVEAKRQQARVLGWGGLFHEAKLRYASLVREYPGDVRLTAEAAAKGAFFDGRWRAAADAYQRWLALEPDNSEARFEHAESLRAAGDTPAAEAELRLLNSAGQHQVASQVLDRERVNRAPSIGLIGDVHGSKGYDNQRLLDIKQTGAAFRTSLGRAESSLRLAVTRVAMVSENQELRGNRIGLEAGFLLSPRMRIAGTAAGWDLGMSGGPAVDGSVTSVWSATDRWNLSGGFERTSVLENLDTVVGRLQGTGPFASLAFESPMMTFEFRASAQELSDDNDRQRATLTWTRALSARLNHIRLIGWAETLRYRTSSPDYFSPSGQIRADGGLQYTHEFSTPRFRNDRQQTLSFGYLIGFDDDGETYHHPMMNLAIEFARGLSIDARANWIRSDVYRETSVFVGMTFKARARTQ